MIQIRKNHPAFRLNDSKQVSTLVHFLENSPPGVIVYEINGKKVNDKWEKIQVMFNGTSKSQLIELNSKLWLRAVINNRKADGKNVLASVELAPFSCTILYQNSKSLKN